MINEHALDRPPWHDTFSNEVRGVGLIIGDKTTDLCTSLKNGCGITLSVTQPFNKSCIGDVSS